MRRKLVAPYDVTCAICGASYKTMRPNETSHPQCVRRLARLEREKLCKEYAEKHYGALHPPLAQHHIYDALVRALNHPKEGL